MASLQSHNNAVYLILPITFYFSHEISLVIAIFEQSINTIESMALLEAHNGYEKKCP